MAIQQNNELPPKLLRERKIMTHPVHALLYGSQPGRGRRSFADVVNANMFEQKLEFLLSVMEQWVEGGGLGCIRGRTGTGEFDRLQWQGLWVKEHARKMDWVTVGKLGGDEA
jgi:myosin-1